MCSTCMATTTHRQGVVVMALVIVALVIVVLRNQGAARADFCAVTCAEELLYRWAANVTGCMRMAPA